jgi:hypothetical protein
MTAAQRNYLTAQGIDPWSLVWANASALGFPRWGNCEAADLPDGRVLLPDGTAHEPSRSAPKPERKEGDG